MAVLVGRTGSGCDMMELGQSCRQASRVTARKHSRPSIGLINSGASTFELRGLPFF